MNEQVVREACLRLSFRQCALYYGISYHTWRHVRLTGEIPEDRRGRPRNDALTQAILTTIRQHPEYSMERIAYTLGCSKVKVAHVCKEHDLVYLWQRLRYADVQLKELDPDLVRARQNPLKVDGPGALVHLDSKKYASLKGGIWVVGVVTVDNFSGFTDLRLCPNGRKGALNSVRALERFLPRFPCPVRKILTDQGSEFLNAMVLSFCEEHGIQYRTTKRGHPWSNGKAEKTQALLKREIIIPLLAREQWDNLTDLQHAIDERLIWFNGERPHFGRVNQGIPPTMVAEACAGLEEAERTQALANLRMGLRWAKRAEWLRDAGLDAGA
ncbi:MAG: DDE-type integrase/transposase/recombinase [Acidithiobacillus sp.]